MYMDNQGYMKSQPGINVPWQLFLAALCFFSPIFITNCIYHEGQARILEKIKNCARPRIANVL